MQSIVTDSQTRKNQQKVHKNHPDTHKLAQQHPKAARTTAIKLK